MKKQRPILFSTAMVQAILAGNKTQTRRVIKNEHVLETIEFLGGGADGELATTDSIRQKWQDGELRLWSDEVPEYGYEPIKCPYGKPGDVLWVRETWAKNDVLPIEDRRKGEYVYKADNVVSGTWKSSLHMPKDAARIFLEITNIRVERLQDISEADSKAEGVYFYGNDDPDQLDYRNYLHPMDDDWGLQTAKESFETLWESINGKESWQANPWVWVVEFKHIEKP